MIPSKARLVRIFLAAQDATQVWLLTADLDAADRVKALEKSMAKLITEIREITRVTDGD